MGRDQRIRRRRFKDQSSIYCGVQPGTTFDHVPPRNLFPKPRPSNLPKVPCCEPCRRTQSLDDEYFRTMVVMRHDVAEHPEARRVLAAVHRGLARPEGRGFATLLLQSLRHVEIRTEAGLHAGRGATYNVSIVQRADGRWMARVDLGWCEGKRRSKAIYGRTRRAVADGLRDALKAAQHGTLVADERQTIGEFLTRWLEDVARTRVRPRTFVGYEAAIERHIRPQLGRVRIAKLTPQHCKPGW